MYHLIWFYLYDFICFFNRTWAFNQHSQHISFTGAHLCNDIQSQYVGSQRISRQGLWWRKPQEKMYRTASGEPGQVCVWQLSDWRAARESHTHRCTSGKPIPHTDALTSNSKAHADYGIHGLLKPTGDQAAWTDHMASLFCDFITILTVFPDFTILSTERCGLWEGTQWYWNRPLSKTQRSALRRLRVKPELLYLKLRDCFEITYVSDELQLAGHYCKINPSCMIRTHKLNSLS